MIRNIIVSCLSFILFITCANSKFMNTPSEEASNQQSIPIEYEQLAFSENGSGTPSQNLVIRNQNDFAIAWSQAYDKMSPKPSLPAINFDNESVLFIDFGQRNHGGFKAEIEGIEMTKDTAIVSIQKPNQDQNNPNQLYTSVMTRPFMFIKINQTQLTQVKLK